MQKALVGGVVATEVLQELMSYVHDLPHTVVILHGKDMHNYYKAKLKFFAGQKLYQARLPSHSIQKFKYVMVCSCQRITHR